MVSLMSIDPDRGAGGPGSDLDPFSGESLADPLPALAALRDAGPAVYLTRYRVWAVAGHRDVHADAAGLGEDGAALLVRSLFSAGVDTTVSALAFAIYGQGVPPDPAEPMRP